MKTIKVRKEVRDNLKEFGDGKSINMVMKTLLADVETDENDVADAECEYININMDDELLPKLRSCKIHPRESYSDVITRLLNDYTQEE